MTSTDPALNDSYRWRRFATRGLRTEGSAVVIAVCLWALTGRAFGVMLVYSVCISTMCWLFIDGGRGIVASWTKAKPPHDRSVASRWPGWKCHPAGLEGRRHEQEANTSDRCIGRKADSYNF